MSEQGAVADKQRKRPKLNIKVHKRSPASHPGDYVEQPPVLAAAGPCIKSEHSAEGPCMPFAL